MGREKEGMFYLIGLSLQVTGLRSTVSVDGALESNSRATSYFCLEEQVVEWQKIRLAFHYL